MIFEVIQQSLRRPNAMIPVETLRGNCEGSRMPEVIATRLTPAIAQRLVEVCPTAAFRIEEEERHRRPQLKLSYGDCIGCGRCFEPSERAVGACLGPRQPDRDDYPATGTRIRPGRDPRSVWSSSEYPAVGRGLM